MNATWLISSHDPPGGQEMTPSWGPYGPHVGATLLSNSGGMAISATFAEDGMEPETCHLCFTALPLKTCVCMCVRVSSCVCVYVCLCACMCVSTHAGRENHITAPGSRQGVEMLH